MYIGDYERARQELERFLASATGNRDDYVRILLLDNKPGEALEYLESVDDEALSDWERMSLIGSEAMTRYSLGETKRAAALLAELIRSDYFDKRSVSFFVAETAAWMGEKDLAFDRLFEMQATNFNYLQRRAFSPTWRNLHDDPRWLEWRAAYGLAPARLDAIEFDPWLPD